MLDRQDAGLQEFHVNDYNKVAALCEAQLIVLKTEKYEDGKQPILAKQWKSAVGVEGYDRARTFTPTGYTFNDLGGLHGLLEELRHDPHVCVVRGALTQYGLEQTERGNPISRRSVDKKDNPATLESTARDWVMLDIEVPALVGIDPIRSVPESVEAFFSRYIPELGDVSYIWHLSGSAGHPTKEGEFRAHVWILLENPLMDSQIKAWASQFKQDNGKFCLDLSVFQAGQPHYTSDPVRVGEGETVYNKVFDGVQRIGIVHKALERFNMPGDCVAKYASKSSRVDSFSDEDAEEAWGQLCEAYPWSKDGKFPQGEANRPYKGIYNGISGEVQTAYSKWKKAKDGRLGGIMVLVRAISATYSNPEQIRAIIEDLPKDHAIGAKVRELQALGGWEREITRTVLKVLLPDAREILSTREASDVPDFLLKAMENKVGASDKEQRAKLIKRSVDLTDRGLDELAESSWTECVLGHYDPVEEEMLRARRSAAKKLAGLNDMPETDADLVLWEEIQEDVYKLLSTNEALVVDRLMKSAGYGNRYRVAFQNDGRPVHYRLDRKLGVEVIPNFEDQTEEDFEKAIIETMERGLDCVGFFRCKDVPTKTMEAYYKARETLVKGGTIKTIQEKFRSRTKVHISSSFIDAPEHTDWIALAGDGGVVNAKDGLVLTHGEALDRGMLITPRLGTDRITGEDCPNYKKHLLWTLRASLHGEPTEEDRARVEEHLRFLGLALIDSGAKNGTHVFTIQKGSGRNGKGFLSRIEAEILGGYAGSIESHNFVASKFENEKQGNNELASLRNKRVVFTSELKAGAYLHTARIKNLSGGDKINPRLVGLGQQDEGFEFPGLIFVSTNHDPRFVEVDEGIKNRLRVEYFPRTAGEADIIRTNGDSIRAAIMAEAPAVIAEIMAAGLRAIEDRKSGRSMGAKDNWTATTRKHSEMVWDGQEPFRVFMEDRYEPKTDGMVEIKDILNTYRASLEDEFAHIEDIGTRNREIGRVMPNRNTVKARLESWYGVGSVQYVDTRGKEPKALGDKNVGNNGKLYVLGIAPRARGDEPAWMRRSA